MDNTNRPSLYSLPIRHYFCSECNYGAVVEDWLLGHIRFLDLKFNIQMIEVSCPTCGQRYRLNESEEKEFA